MSAWTADPWKTERERAGSCTVLRIIDVAAGTQAFQILPWPPRHATHEDYERYRLLDGCTLIQGTDRGLEHEERLAVIRKFDALWREARASAKPEKP